MMGHVIQVKTVTTVLMIVVPKRMVIPTANTVAMEMSRRIVEMRIAFALQLLLPHRHQLLQLHHNAVVMVPRVAAMGIVAATSAGTAPVRAIVVSSAHRSKIALNMMS